MDQEQLVQEQTGSAGLANLPSNLLTGDPYMDGLLRKVHSMVPDAEGDEISKLADKLGMNLNSNTQDYLYQYYLNEKASKNAFDRSMEASNTQYQRAKADLEKSGLNPFLVFQSLSGSSPASTSGNVQGGLFTSRANQKTQSSNQLLGTGFSILAIIAAALIHALI